jgi:hypothetical protein
MNGSLCPITCFKIMIRGNNPVGQRNQKDSMQRRNTARRVESNMVKATFGQVGRWIRVLCRWTRIVQVSKRILLLGHGQGKDGLEVWDCKLAVAF